MNPAGHHRAEFFLQWKLGMCGNQTPHSTPGSLYIAGPRGPATSFNCGQWGAGHLLTGFEAAAFQWVPSGVFGELTMAAESPEHGLLAALALQRRTFVPTAFVFLVFLVVWSRISVSQPAIDWLYCESYFHSFQAVRSRARAGSSETILPCSLAVHPTAAAPASRSPPQLLPLTRPWPCTSALPCTFDQPHMWMAVLCRMT